tara:strand:- start:4029 stop:5105 length:1077 start_codon:yes stop_codon:yes gene_type:complete
MNEKFSYTTGTYAAAAAKAAVQNLLGENYSENVEIKLPANEKAVIPVNHRKQKKNCAECSVTKKSIEEADVTNNMEIIARVSLREDDQIIIDGGKGVGRITKPGLQLPVGEAAINPIPRKMILSSIKELTDRGVNVLISVPDGEEIAAKTTNARLGIIGGISIIGTTGIMKPKSLSSFKQTIVEQLNFCKKNEFSEVIITPGNISEQAMQKHFRDKFQDHQIVQSGDYLGFTLKNALKMKFSIILAGHPGKLAKVLSGHFQTHYTKSPAANKAVVSFFKNSVDKAILNELKESPTIEGMINILQKHDKVKLFHWLAETIEKKVQAYLKTDLTVPTLLFNMNKELVGYSKAGRKWINHE